MFILFSSTHVLPFPMFKMSSPQLFMIVKYGFKVSSIAFSQNENIIFGSSTPIPIDICLGIKLGTKCQTSRKTSKSNNSIFGYWVDKINKASLYWNIQNHWRTACTQTMQTYRKITSNNNDSGGGGDGEDFPKTVSNLSARSSFSLCLKNCYLL